VEPRQDATNHTRSTAAFLQLHDRTNDLSYVLSDGPTEPFIEVRPTYHPGTTLSSRSAVRCQHEDRLPIVFCVHAELSTKQLPVYN